MRRALFLACLTLGPASAVPPRMSDPPRTTFNLPARLSEARPTLDLLVTVRLLDTMLEHGTLLPGAQGRAELAGVLRTLRDQPTLGPLNAERALNNLRAALTSGQRQSLDAARADHERRADLLLARARLATPNGAPNLTLSRYGFLVPGGPLLVRQVTANPTLNPYAGPGTNADLLARVLTRLAL